MRYLYSNRAARSTKSRAHMHEQTLDDDAHACANALIAIVGRPLFFTVIQNREIPISSRVEILTTTVVAPGSLIYNFRDNFYLSYRGSYAFGNNRMFDVVLLMVNFVYLVLFDVPIAFLIALFKRNIIPDFSNDIVLITGAAQGIGKELAIQVSTYNNVA